MPGGGYLGGLLRRRKKGVESLLMPPFLNGPIAGFDLFEKLGWQAGAVGIDGVKRRVLHSAVAGHGMGR